MMGLVSWLILGLAAGFLAKKIVPGDEGGGLIVTILLGIGGAIVGGFIGSFLGLGSVTGFSLWGLVLATGGAVLLIFIYNKLKKRGPNTPS